MGKALRAKVKKYKVALVVTLLIVIAWSLGNPFSQVYFDLALHTHEACTANIPYASAAMGLIRPLIYIGLFTAWGLKISHSVINRKLRRYLEYIDVCCILWIVLRMIKYEMTFQGDAINLFIQYMYFISLILIPTFVFFASLHVRRSEKYEIPKKLYFFVICISTIMIIFSLTNNCHNLIWKSAGGTLTSQSYIHGIGYYIIAAWIILLAVFAVAIILVRTRIPNKRYVAVKPLIIFAAIIGYFILKSTFPAVTRYIANDYSTFTCLATLVFLESCLSTGMLPTNVEYEKLFHASIINMIITDDDWNICYCTDNADIYDKKTLQLTEHGRVEQGSNTLIQGYNLNPGHAVWIEDISELTRVINKLQKNRDELSARYELEKENSKTKLELHRALEKNRLYDLFQDTTAKQNALLEEILTRYFEETDEKVKTNLLGKAAVIGAYIKRRGNLILTAEKNGKIYAEELRLCLHESIRNMELIKIHAFMDFCVSKDREWNAESVCLIYDTFEMIIEEVLEDCSSIYIKIAECDGRIEVFFSIAAKKDISGLKFLPQVSLERDNDSWEIGFSLSKAGKIS